jgi:hypothetical protein
MTSFTDLITREQGADVAACSEAANSAARALAQLQLLIEDWQRSSRRTLIGNLIDQHGLTEGQAEAISRYAQRGLSDAALGLIACRNGFESLADGLDTVIDEVNSIRKTMERGPVDTVTLVGAA